MLLLVLGGAAVTVLGEDRHEVGPGVVQERRASPAAATRALAALTTALDARDPRAVADLAPDGDEEARTLLEGVGRNTRSLALDEVDLRYVDQTGTVRADGSWTAVAELRWRIGGEDAAASSAEVLVALTPDGDRLAVAGFPEPTGQAGARLPLWLRGELSVSRSPGVLVLVDGTQRLADDVARRAAVGRGVVRRVLPEWSAPVVVEVPSSAADLDATLGAEPGTYAAIAAVTTAAGSADDGSAPVHVFVNPEVTAGLRRAGAQVVMSHELVHVATDATRTPMEPWLLEGFADYVALRDVGLPDRTTLGRAIRAVRRDGVPDALPSAADLDTRAPDLQARYEEAWLACRVLAERLGESGLVTLYRGAAEGRPLAALLRDAGWSSGGLAQAWRVRLAAASR